MLDDDEQLTIRRALRAPEFWLLAVAATCATFGMSAWVTIPTTLAALSISSLPKYIELWPRARDVGAAGEWWRTVALSTFSSFAASSGAHLAGLATRWLWF